MYQKPYLQYCDRSRVGEDILRGVLSGQSCMVNK